MPTNRTWFKFHADKWMGDIELRMCSPIARSLLIDLMAISFPSGSFSLKKGTEKRQFLKQIGFKPKQFERSLNELLNKKRIILDENEDVFYIPRMRNDYKQSLKGQQNGALGGNPALSGVNPQGTKRVNPDKNKNKNNKEVRGYHLFGEIFGILTPNQMTEVLPILKQAKDIDRFVEQARRIYNQADANFKPNPVTLAQKTHAAIAALPDPDHLKDRWHEIQREKGRTEDEIEEDAKSKPWRIDE